MMRRKPGPGRLFAICLLVMMAASCSRDEHPRVPELESLDVPEFEMLGFADALVPVRTQVLEVYESWQENPLDADLNGSLAMHLSVYGKLDAAGVLYRRARLLAPGELRWAYYLAHTLNELGQQDEAIGMFREVLKIDRGHTNARLQLAKLLLESGDLEGSRNLYQSFTVDFPKRVEGWLGLGKADFRLGNNDEAAVALWRARALGSQYGEVHYALAFVLRAMGDNDAAKRELAAYERTAQNKIRTHDSLLQKAKKLYAGDSVHYNTAVYYYGREDFKQSAKSFRDTLTVNPANVDAWAGLVSTQVRLGEIDAAGEIYREAVAAGVNYARLHLVYGEALLDRQQLDAARDTIGLALALDPQYGDALSAMGEIELLSGASVAAIEIYRRLLFIRPNDPRVKLSLAQSLNAAGQFDEAAGLLEPLTTDPEIETSLVLKELAFAYRGMGREDEASEVLQRGR